MHVVQRLALAGKVLPKKISAVAPTRLGGACSVSTWSRLVAVEISNQATSRADKTKDTSRSSCRHDFAFSLVISIRSAPVCAFVFSVSTAYVPRPDYALRRSDQLLCGGRALCLGGEDADKLGGNVEEEDGGDEREREDDDDEGVTGG
jgi:hypothetical protein